MGNMFSSCFPKKKPEGHKLGVRKDYDNNTTSNGNRTNGSGKASGGQSLGDYGRTVGTAGVSGANNGEGPSREEMAAAAQKRQENAKSKGIQKGGGKLSKKLEEQQKNPNQPNLPPSNTNLQWRAD